jgi:uncharacterized protein
MATEVVTCDRIPQNAKVIEAFPSNGFVSTIVAQQIIEQLNMKMVGYVESDKTKGIAVVHKSKPLRPVRIYAKDNLIIVYSEMIIPLENLSDFSQGLWNWFKKIRPSEVFLLAGVSGVEVEGEHEILGIATTEELTRKLGKTKVKLITDGMITGVSADLLMYCMNEAIPCVSLVTETQYVPDPTAAASMLKILNELLGININTKDLAEAGAQVETRVKEITEQLKRGREKYRRMEGMGPMYG